MLPHVSSIKTETQICLLGFPKFDENLRVDFGLEIWARKSESHNFDAQSSKGSSSS
ncbi:unnamed protein product, partial [Heterotrigona itama]